MSESTTREGSGATGKVAAEKKEAVGHSDSQVTENVEPTDSQVLSSLSPEVLHHILSFCETDSLGRLRRVSHHVKSMVDHYIVRLPRSADMLRRSAVCDGEYRLAVTTDRFGVVPLRVYCHGMSTENPKEYITLRNDGPDDNFSELVKQEMSVTGPGVRTSFRKVRLDVAKMQLVCSDFTFAESYGWGMMDHGNGTKTLFRRMPLGTAQNCGTWQNATANVDLRGTGLCIDCSFEAYGVDAEGQSEFKEGRQMVAISGGGFPGGCGPKSAMLAHDKACELGSEPFPIEKVWDNFVPVVMKVDIARRGNPL